MKEMLRRLNFACVAALVLFALVFVLIANFATPLSLAAPLLQETATPTPAPTPLAAFNVSHNSGNSDYPNTIFDAQGTLHVFWVDSSRDQQAEDVLHRQLSSDGKWSEIENLSTDFDRVFENSLRTIFNRTGQACVFWDGTTKRAPTELALYMRCQTGSSWSAPQKVKDTNGTHRDDYPVFASDGSVKTMYTTGAGTTMFEDLQLSDNEKAAYLPAFIADNAGGYHAIWTRQGDQFTLEHRYSSDGGQTWNAAEQLTDDKTQSGGTIALAADAQNRVHLAWVGLDDNTYYRRRSRNGSWAPAVDLRQGQTGNNSTSLGLAVSANGLASVVWQSFDGIHYVEQPTDDTWTPPRLIATSVSSGPGPVLAIDNQGLRHFVWKAGTPNADLFYASMQSITTVTVNAPASPFEYKSPFFKNHIHDPSILTSVSPAVVATNFLLALILALAMGFFGNLLNDTLEAHEDRVARLLGPLNNLVPRSRAITRNVDEGFRARRVAWLGTFSKIVVMLLILGVIFAFVDPNFDPTHPDAALAVVALALSFGLISLVDDFAQYLYLQRHGESPQLRVHAGNAVIAVIAAMSSRVLQITPGLLIGSPAGIEEVRETQVEAYLHLVAMSAVALITLAAWFSAPFVSTNLYLVTILLLIFAVGVQTLFFEMMPLRNLHGQGIFEYNRVLWGLLLGIVTWLFLTTMLNPEGEFLNAFAQPNMITLAWTVAIFCAFSAVVWAYFELTDKRQPRT